MSLVWKLMRRHISLGQLAGFFFANLCGMVIVLLSIQFYQDVAPVFTEGDSFMKKDYIIVSKKVSTLGSFVGKSSTFSASGIEEIEESAFQGCSKLGKVIIPESVKHIGENAFKGCKMLSEDIRSGQLGSK